MADIRINALATTAASTASDDFVAVDGSANGTRKLSAYSPTFGGNLTVNGTGTSTFAGNVAVANTLSAKDTNAALTLQAGPGTGGINYGFGQGSGDHVWYNGTDEKMRLSAAGNLTAAGTGSHVFGTTNTITLSAGRLTATKGLIVSDASTSTGITAELSGATAATLRFNKTNATAQSWQLTSTGNFTIEDVTASTTPFVIASSTGNATLAGSLTANGGSVTVNNAAGAEFVVKRDINSTGGYVRFKTSTTDDWLIGTGATGAESNLSIYSYGTSAVALGINRTTGNVTLAGSLQTGANVSDVAIYVPGGAALRTVGGGSLYIDTAHPSASIILRSGNVVPALTLDSSQNATFAGNITTAAPSGGTAGSWKLGIRVAATTTLDTTQYLQVDIGGTLYKVALVTS